MSDDQKNDPGARMRSMLGSSLPKKEGGAQSFLSKLPQKPGGASSPALAPKAAPAPAAPKQKEKSESKFSIAPVFWTIASALSLIVNIVLLLILIFVFSSLRKAKINVLTVGPDLLGGLYSNFEKMDDAHITKTIPVEAQIPVQFDLQLNQQTNVVLSENVVITNALVTVNTGGLNINRAAANIILPQGTSLPIFLNLTVPVDTSIPVQLNVAVDIPLNETQLHEPFVGLSDVVAPLYCLFDANAKNGKGEMICK